MSDDTKWYVTVVPMYAALVCLVILVVWLWRKNKHDRVWKELRMGHSLDNGYSEADLIHLEKNAENLRRAYKIMADNMNPCFECPWGDECPAKKYFTEHNSNEVNWWQLPNGPDGIDTNSDPFREVRPLKDKESPDKEQLQKLNYAHIQYAYNVTRRLIDKRKNDRVEKSTDSSITFETDPAAVTLRGSDTVRLLVY